MAAEQKMIQYLPGVYRKQLETQSGTFFEQFLGIFDTLLLKEDPNAASQQSIKEILKYVHEMINPAAPWLYDPNYSNYLTLAQEDYLDWMAGWFAFLLDTDWSTQKKQSVLSKIIPLYRIRGTKKGLVEYLKIAVPGGSEGIEIIDNVTPFQVGDANVPLDKQSSQLGLNSVVGGIVAHYFKVIVKLVSQDIALLPYKKKIVTRIIDMEKPVHTHYDVVFETPKLQVELQSKVGVDTLI